MDARGEAGAPRPAGACLPSKVFVVSLSSEDENAAEAAADAEFLAELRAFKASQKTTAPQKTTNPEPCGPGLEADFVKCAGGTIDAPNTHESGENFKGERR